MGKRKRLLPPVELGGWLTPHYEWPVVPHNRPPSTIDKIIVRAELGLVTGLLFYIVYLCIQGIANRP